MKNGEKFLTACIEGIVKNKRKVRNFLIVLLIDVIFVILNFIKNNSCRVKIPF